MERQDSISKLQRAKSRVEKLKKFYTHLGIYFIINSVITGFKVSNNLDSWDAFQADLLSFSTLSSWIIWGIILVIHAFTVFVLPSLLGYDWEERKIQKYMEEELKSKK
ncbi:2TM domain-containing protein [Winogradskyella haliclonae]|uniref:Histidine kinase n=1 Tax=Winogradskyella haliclonae TaxID=2048558 RepID=A0ABQ2BZU2_9FLAO|nr:2TM domain-containing protein [Winogradskyella haliclonae]GGI58005.1 histidine kinase [Winogradskyella haliclonae]